MSTLASPSTPSRPNSVDEPRLSHTIEELTTAPSSMVLNGYTLTSAPRVALAPTCTSSPITTPSSTRTLARRFTPLPTTAPRSRLPEATYTLSWRTQRSMWTLASTRQWEPSTV